MRCCRSAWPETPRVEPAAEFSDRSARSSGPFSAPTFRAAGCRPARSSREASRARSPTMWSAGSLPTSANPSAARSAVRSAGRWCAARSAGCCADRIFSLVCRDVVSLLFLESACAEISVVAISARYSFSGLLYRADGRRSRSGNLGARKDKRLSALVLVRAAGAAGKGSLPQRSPELFQFHLSAAPRGPARDPKLFRQAASLHLPVCSQRGRVVDDGAILERDDRLGADTGAVAGGAAGYRHHLLCVRHVRSRAAQPGSAGND